MSVHYKFKSTLDFDTITFDGLNISVGELKKAIIQQKRLGKITDFDLQITNAQTKEEYNDDACMIPKNTSLIIARIPLAHQPKKSWDPNEKHMHTRASGKIEGSISSGVGLDISKMQGSEEDKIQAMMAQSTADYDPKSYQRIRPQPQTGEVPSTYRCNKCKKGGHWIKNCPFNISKEHLEIKRNTGIPRSFQNKDESEMETNTETEPIPENKQEIPDDLICSICHDLFTDAVMMPCCGSSFCDDCVRTALIESEDNECPDCKEKGSSPESLIPNRFLRNSVNTFKNTTGYSAPTKLKKVPQVLNTEPQEDITPMPENTDTVNATASATPNPTTTTLTTLPAATSVNVTVAAEGENSKDPDAELSNDKESSDSQKSIEKPAQMSDDNSHSNSHAVENSNDESQFKPVADANIKSLDSKKAGDDAATSNAAAAGAEKHIESQSHDEAESDFEDNITVTMPPAQTESQRAMYRERQIHNGRNMRHPKPPGIENSPLNQVSPIQSHRENNQQVASPHRGGSHIKHDHGEQEYRDGMQNPDKGPLMGHRPQHGAMGNVPPPRYPHDMSDRHMRPMHPQEMYPNIPIQPRPPYAQMPAPYPMGQSPPQGPQPPMCNYDNMYHQMDSRPPNMLYPGPGVPPYQRPPFMPNMRPGMPMRGPHPDMRPSLSMSNKLVASVYEGVAAKVGTGIIDDPLEAFNRLMKEQEKRKEERRRSPEHRRSRSQERHQRGRYRISPPPERRNVRDMNFIKDKRGRSRDHERRRVDRVHEKNVGERGEKSFRRRRSNSFSDRSSRSRSWSGSPYRKRSRSPMHYKRSRSRTHNFADNKNRQIADKGRPERKENDFHREGSPQNRRSRSRGVPYNPNRQQRGPGGGSFGGHPYQNDYNDRNHSRDMNRPSMERSPLSPHFHNNNEKMLKHHNEDMLKPSAFEPPPPGFETNIPNLNYNNKWSSAGGGGGMGGMAVPVGMGGPGGSVRPPNDRRYDRHTPDLYEKFVSEDLADRKYFERTERSRSISSKRSPERKMHQRSITPNRKPNAVEHFSKTDVNAKREYRKDTRENHRESEKSREQRDKENKRDRERERERDRDRDHRDRDHRERDREREREKEKEKEKERERERDREREREKGRDRDRDHGKEEKQEEHRRNKSRERKTQIKDNHTHHYHSNRAEAETLNSIATESNEKEKRHKAEKSHKHNVEKPKGGGSDNAEVDQNPQHHHHHRHASMTKQSRDGDFVEKGGKALSPPIKSHAKEDISSSGKPEKRSKERKKKRKEKKVKKDKKEKRGRSKQRAAHTHEESHPSEEDAEAENEEPVHKENQQRSETPQHRIEHTNSLRDVNETKQRSVSPGSAVRKENFNDISKEQRNLNTSQCGNEDEEADNREEGEIVEKNEECNATLEDKINVLYDDLSLEPNKVFYNDDDENHRRSSNNTTPPPNFIRFDSVLDIHGYETDFDDALTNKKQPTPALLPPMLSKWEVDDFSQNNSNATAATTIATAITIPDDPKDSDDKVTSEVLRKAENAIFARAISAIRPIESKRSASDVRTSTSSDRRSPSSKRYQRDNSTGSSTLPGFQITVPTSGNHNQEQRSVELKDSDNKKTTTHSTKSPTRTKSIKDRLGSKVSDKNNSDSSSLFGDKQQQSRSRRERSSTRDATSRLDARNNKTTTTTRDRDRKSDDQRDQRREHRDGRDRATGAFSSSSNNSKKSFSDQASNRANRTFHGSRENEDRERDTSRYNRQQHHSTQFSGSGGSGSRQNDDALRPDSRHGGGGGSSRVTENPFRKNIDNGMEISETFDIASGHRDHVSSKAQASSALTSIVTSSSALKRKSKTSDSSSDSSDSDSDDSGETRRKKRRKEKKEKKRSKRSSSADSDESSKKKHKSKKKSKSAKKKKKNKK